MSQFWVGGDEYIHCRGNIKDFIGILDIPGYKYSVDYTTNTANYQCEKNELEKICMSLNECNENNCKSKTYNEIMRRSGWMRHEKYGHYIIIDMPKWGIDELKDKYRQTEQMYGTYGWKEYWFEGLSIWIYYFDKNDTEVGFTGQIMVKLKTERCDLTRVDDCGERISAILESADKDYNAQIAHDEHMKDYYDDDYEDYGEGYDEAYDELYDEEQQNEDHMSENNKSENNMSENNMSENNMSEYDEDYEEEQESQGDVTNGCVSHVQQEENNVGIREKAAVVSLSVSAGEVEVDNETMIADELHSLVEEIKKRKSQSENGNLRYIEQLHDHIAFLQKENMYLREALEEITQRSQSVTR